MEQQQNLRLSALTLLVLYIASAAVSWGDDSPRTDRKPIKPPTNGTVSRLEARLADGSVLKITLLDPQLRLKTDYGELSIPAGDIRRIDFATRIGDDLALAIRSAVAKLADDEYEVRERASEKLAAFGAVAYPALLEAVKAEDLEVVHRAEKLLAALRDALPAEQLEVRADDIVHTAKSRIAGQIDAASLLVGTEPFGKQELKLTSLRSLRAAASRESEDRGTLPDPGTLSNYQGQAGKRFRFRVTGGAPQFGGGFGGAVWGSDVYTLDSTVAVAAVHAGVLQNGEAGIVEVAILGPQNSFQGSTRNGITTSPWGHFPGGFKFVRDEDEP